MFFRLTVLLLISSVYTYAQPTINSFTPESGPAGTTVTINGSGFNTSTSDNIVYFGAVKAVVASASSNSLLVTVPAGSTYQPISVTTNGQTAFSTKPFQLTFSTIGSLTSAAFLPKADYQVDLYPYGITVADFDNDGKADIVSASGRNSPSTTISILRNTSTVNGAISFATRDDMPSSLQLYSINSGDIDGDGRKDVITGSIGDQNISVFRNTSSPGSISFNAKVDFSSATSPYEIAVGDLNNDGKPDLAVASFTANVIGVFINTSVPGTISFNSRIDFTTGLGPKSVAVADMDGDGKLDLLATNYFGNSISVLKNTSSGSVVNFAPKTDFTTGTKPCAIIATDFDGDGKPDISFLADAFGSLVFWRNTSSGSISFTNSGVYNPVSGQADVRKIAAGNIDSDAKPDVVISGPGNRVICYRNNSTPGNISFSNAAVLSMYAPFVAGIADVNLDSKPDIIAGSISSDYISVFAGQMGAPVISSFTPASAGSGITVTITGSNLSGTNAVSFGGIAAQSFTVTSPTTITAVVGSGASGDIVVNNAEGAGGRSGFTFLGPPSVISFAPNSGPPGTQVTITGSGFLNVTGVTFGGVAASSFTVNSATSITATVANGASGNVTVTTSYGSGSAPNFMYTGLSITGFSPAIASAGATITINGANFNGVTSVLFGGTPAVSFTVVNASTITAVVAGGSSGDLSVSNAAETISITGFIFQYSGQPHISSITPASAIPGATVILNGSNFNTTAAGNAVFFGAVKGTVTQASPTQLLITLPTGSTCHYVKLTNLANGLAASSVRQFIPTFAGSTGNLSPGAFSTRKDINSDPNTYPTYGDIFDLDGDGKPEIIAAILSHSSPIHLFKNNSSPGSLSFGSAINVAGLSSYYTAFGDIDGDGKVDIVGSTNNPTVHVARNLGNLNFAPVKTFAAGGDTHMSDVSDIDGDGRPEILTSNYGSFNISILRNTSVPGIISFAAKKDFPCFGLARAVVAGDLNNDGKPDVVSANGSESTITVFANNSTPGNILLSTGVTYPAGNNATNVRIVDFDNDGRQDIVVVNVWGLTFSVFRNASTTSIIQLEAKVDYALPSSNYGIAGLDIGDVDGDGKVDVVVASGSLGVYKNTSTPGAISFAAPVTFGSGTPYSSSLGDLDGDKRPDITAMISNWNRISVYRNNVLLPLTLLEFTGTRQQNDNVLSWHTTNEVNTASFAVEYSSNGQLFTMCGSVIARNIPELNKYSFVHAANTSGDQFYRLKMVDKDGTFTYSQLIKISNHQVGLKLAPNPTSGRITLSYPLLIQDAQVTICNIAGHTLKQVVLRKSTTTSIINLNVMPKGTYVLRFSVGDILWEKRFVIAR